MNYTTNVHLPQWAEDDPILRVDFNQMCANIDAAITSAATTGQRTESEAWDGLLRTARQNLGICWPGFSQDSIYSGNGLVYNPLSRQELSQTLSGLVWDGQKGVCAGRGASLGTTVLRGGCIDFWPGNSNTDVSASDAYALYRFNAPVDGVVRECALFLYTLFTAALPEIRMTLAFTAEKRNAGGGFDEIYRKLFLIERSGTETKRQEIPLELGFPIEKGAEYRLKLSLMESTGRIKVPGRFGFVVDRVNESSPAQGYTDHSSFHVEKPPITTGSLTRAFSAEGTATRGLVMVHYMNNVEQSRISPSLDGKGMRLISMAQRYNGDKSLYWEAWFTCTGSFAHAVQLRIDVNADKDDDFRLMRYGVVML